MCSTGRSPSIYVYFLYLLLVLEHTHGSLKYTFFIIKRQMLRLVVVHNERGAAANYLYVYMFFFLLLYYYYILHKGTFQFARIFETPPPFWCCCAPSRRHSLSTIITEKSSKAHPYEPMVLLVCVCVCALQCTMSTHVKQQLLHEIQQQFYVCVLLAARFYTNKKKKQFSCDICWNNTKMFYFLKVVCVCIGN